MIRNISKRLFYTHGAFHRKPRTKGLEGCLESSVVQSVIERGAVVTRGPTWARSV